MTDRSAEGVAAQMLNKLEKSKGEHHLAWEACGGALKMLTVLLLGILAWVGTQVAGSIDQTRTEIPKLSTAVKANTAALIEVKDAVRLVQKKVADNHSAVERIQQTHQELYEHRFKEINMKLDKLEGLMRGEIRRTKR